MSRFDGKLGQILPKLGERDLLILTADHGNDPTRTGTDHTREKALFLAWSPSMEEGGQLPKQESFSVIGATVRTALACQRPTAPSAYPFWTN